MRRKHSLGLVRGEPDCRRISGSFDDPPQGYLPQQQICPEIEHFSEAFRWPCLPMRHARNMDLELEGALIAPLSRWARIGGRERARIFYPFSISVRSMNEGPKFSTTSVLSPRAPTIALAYEAVERK